MNDSFYTYHIRMVRDLLNKLLESDENIPEQTYENIYNAWSTLNMVDNQIVNSDQTQYDDKTLNNDQLLGNEYDHTLQLIADHIELIEDVLDDIKELMNKLKK